MIFLTLHSFLSEKKEYSLKEGLIKSIQLQIVYKIGHKYIIYIS